MLGFAREALVGAALGAGPVADAFYTALALPNLFRRIFAEGAFNTAFVPLFAKELEAGGWPAHGHFAAQVVSVLVPVLLVLTVLCMVAMPAIVWLNAPGFADTPDKFDVTVTMARIMFPYLFCLSLVAMLSGVLNAMRRYMLAALAPVLLNIIMVGRSCAGPACGHRQHDDRHLAGMGRVCLPVSRSWRCWCGARGGSNLRSCPDGPVSHHRSNACCGSWDRRC